MQNGMDECFLDLCLLHLAKDGASELVGGRLTTHIAGADLASNC